MKNIDIFNFLLNGYNATSYTTNYILGFTFAGMVYMSYAEENQLPFLMKLDSASRGQGYALRFKPNKAQKAMLLNNATPLCSVDFFEDMVAESKYNKGEIFEKLVTESYDQIWEKDNVPYTEAGDIEVNGVAYQIKFEKATFTNEKTLTKIMGLA